MWRYEVANSLPHIHARYRSCLQNRYLEGYKSVFKSDQFYGLLTSCFVWLVAVAPVCKNDDATVVGASLDEVLRVRCHVTADPADVSFVWQFNNSGESFEVEQSRIGTGNGSTSDLSYTPKSERDYGTLACWGRNAIGRQAEPCVFQLVPAGNKP